MTFPFAPRRMRANAAAYYMSVSESTFLARVRAGAYPPGTKDGGITVWLRDDLDRVIDRQFGVQPEPIMRASTKDPFVERFSGTYT